MPRPKGPAIPLATLERRGFVRQVPSMGARCFEAFHCHATSQLHENRFRSSIDILDHSTPIEKRPATSCKPVTHRDLSQIQPQSNASSIILAPPLPHRNQLQGQTQLLGHAPGPRGPLQGQLTQISLGESLWRY